MNVKSNFIIFATAMTLSTAAFAGGGVRSSCQVMDKEGAKVQGTNVDRMFEIASVSKVFTAYWAIKAFGPNYRFQTKFHVTPVDNDTVDIHIQGGMDPLFNAWQMQYAIAEMNKQNIKKVRTLSFDENFAFMMATRTGYAVHGNVTPRDPDPERVKKELETFKGQIHFAYGNFKSRLAETVKIKMPEKLTFSIENIEHVKRSDYAATDKTVSYATKSLPLHMILKEMNRMSNNWAANTIFEFLGGASGFKDFMQKDLGFDDKKVSFINGSGDSWRKAADKPKLYNKATCSAVLAVTVALDDIMTNKYKMGLYDVMAVAGEERGLGYDGGERGTVAGGYSRPETTSSMIAKTGTVDPSVALAGTVETQDGRVYFGYIYLPSARSQLRLDLIRLIKAHNGKEVIDNLPKLSLYSMIDAQAELKRVQSPPVRVAKAEPVKAEPAKTEEAKAEPAKVELTKTEQPKPEAAKTEQAKTDAPKVEKQEVAKPTGEKAKEQNAVPFRVLTRTP